MNQTYSIPFLEASVWTLGWSCLSTVWDLSLPIPSLRMARVVEKGRAEDGIEDRIDRVEILRAFMVVDMFADDCDCGDIGVGKKIQCFLLRMS